MKIGGIKMPHLKAPPALVIARNAATWQSVALASGTVKTVPYGEGHRLGLSYRPSDSEWSVSLMARRDVGIAPYIGAD